MIHDRLAACFVASFVCWAVASGCRERAAERPLSPTEWRNGSPRARAPMVADLIRSRRLIGLDRAAVRDLLGPPDSEGDKTLGYIYFDEILNGDNPVTAEFVDGLVVNVTTS